MPKAESKVCRRANRKADRKAKPACFAVNSTCALARSLTGLKATQPGHHGTIGSLGALRAGRQQPGLRSARIAQCMGQCHHRLQTAGSTPIGVRPTGRQTHSWFPDISKVMQVRKVFNHPATQVRNPGFTLRSDPGNGLAMTSKTTTQYRNRHCEEGEDRRGNPDSATKATSTPVPQPSSLDCFVALAMTDKTSSNPRDSRHCEEAIADAAIQIRPPRPHQPQYPDRAPWIASLHSQ